MAMSTIIPQTIPITNATSYSIVAHGTHNVVGGTYLGVGGAGYVTTTFHQPYQTMVGQMIFQINQFWDQFVCPPAMLESETMYLAGRFSAMSQSVPFHLKVWHKAHADINDFGIFVEYSANLRQSSQQEQSMVRFMFNSQEHCQDFKTWWDSYTKRFQDQSWSADCLPIVKQSPHVRGTLLQFESDTVDPLNRSAMPNERLTESWLWIIQHCQDRVWRVGNEFWVFENERDAVAFKLKWW
jgi:hypothetical protein